MPTFVGLLAAVLIVLSLLTLVAFAGAAVVVTRSTIRTDRADRELHEDLERVLAEILGSAPSHPPTP
ncbi:MAG TPA: hypothetical protein VMV96_05720 [Acidimicrobiales bacterium]|nr:hypothetical protein [Acidimicrobiales bacterium]